MCIFLLILFGINDLINFKIHLHEQDFTEFNHFIRVIWSNFLNICNLTPLAVEWLVTESLNHIESHCNHVITAIQKEFSLLNDAIVQMYNLCRCLSQHCTRIVNVLFV